jgi:signal transduction histidine kinase
LSTDDEGNTYYNGAIVDVTNQVNIEKLLSERNKQLQKTAAQLDRFIYSASHDLRSPITSIMGIVNLMRMELTTEEYHDYLDKIEQSIMKLDNVIRDMMTFSKNTRQLIRCEKISFEPLIHELIAGIEDLERFEEIDFVINIQAKLPFFNDPVRIKSILFQLLKNAVLYMKPQGSPFVRIDVTVFGNKVIIEIIDNGIGISQVHLEKIYDMFYRGTERSAGSGLGLYIVKETLLKINGTITVDSVEGQGSIFHIEIPNSNEGKFIANNLKIHNAG